MRVAIAGFALESVSFLPVPTTLADFERRACYGEAVIAAHRGTNTAIGGFVKVCEAAGAEMVGIVSSDAGAAGSATDEAFRHYSDAICRGIAAENDRIDGILLFLHGAMTTPSRADPETEILAGLRAIMGPALPIMVALDYHGNLDAAILKYATAVFGYHYSPHTDMGETGERAARCLLATLRGEMRPVTAIAKPGVMVPSIFSATDLEPLAGLVRRSLALPREKPGLVDVSLFAGFSYADAPSCGFSVVAVADGDPALAARAAHTAIDEDCFTEFGMRAADFPIIVLRSKTHFRAVYEPLAAEILIVDTPDWGPADLTGLPYRHVPRERVFPFADPPQLL